MNRLIQYRHKPTKKERKKMNINYINLMNNIEKDLNKINDKVFVYDMMNQSNRNYVELTSKLNDLLMFISSKCLNKKKDITSTKIDYSKVNFNSNMIEDYCNNNL